VGKITSILCLSNARLCGYVAKSRERPRVREEEITDHTSLITSHHSAMVLLKIQGTANLLLGQERLRATKILFCSQTKKEFGGVTLLF